MTSPHLRTLSRILTLAIIFQPQSSKLSDIPKLGQYNVGFIGFLYYFFESGVTSENRKNSINQNLKADGKSVRLQTWCPLNDNFPVWDTSSKSIRHINCILRCKDDSLIFRSTIVPSFTWQSTCRQASCLFFFTKTESCHKQYLGIVTQDEDPVIAAAICFPSFCLVHSPGELIRRGVHKVLKPLLMTSLRDGYRYQIGWSFEKNSKRPLTLPPHFWKIMLQNF